MEVETLSRIQFALTVGFHYIYPPMSIGLGLMLVIFEGMYLKTKNRIWEDLTKFWVKIFSLTFAAGVATGIVMVFAFGNNWSKFSRYVGDVFGSALGAEGIFAFFLEAGFLSILLFGWNKVSSRTHFISTILVAIGAHFSAVWIVIANSWMQTPAGHKVVGEGAAARVEIVDFWQMVFNPSAMDRLSHVVIGCWLTGAFLVISVNAYYLLRKRFVPQAITGIKVGTVIAIIATVLQFFAGDSSARGVAFNQPAKLAALEGRFKTEGYAPLSLFGIPDEKEGKMDWSIGIPGLLSWLTYGDPSKPITGLDQIPRDEWPPVNVVFQTYHLMVAMWSLMVLCCLVAIWAWRRKWAVGKPTLWLLTFSVLLPPIANQAGWFSAEMGRQPWIVYGLMKRSAGLSPSVSADQVLGSIIMFGGIYLLMFILFIYLLNNKIQHGFLSSDDPEPLYQRNPLEQTPPKP